MVGKFVIFTLVALCFAQGFHAHTIENRGLIENTIKSIKDIVHKLEEAVHELVTSIPQLLSKLDDTIQNIIDKVIEDTTNLIRKIADINQEILASVGIDISAARACTEAEDKDVENLIKETNASIEKCRQNAEESKDKVRAEMEELKSKAFATIKEINTGLLKCMHDHALNPIKYTKCLTGHLAAVKQKSDALLLQIGETIITANKSTAEIAVNLTKCVARINKQVLTGQKNIIDNFRQCVDELNA